MSARKKNSRLTKKVGIWALIAVGASCVVKISLHGVMHGFSAAGFHMVAEDVLDEHENEKSAPQKSKRMTVDGAVVGSVLQGDTVVASENSPSMSEVREALDLVKDLRQEEPATPPPPAGSKANGGDVKELHVGGTVIGPVVQGDNVFLSRSNEKKHRLSELRARLKSEVSALPPQGTRELLLAKLEQIENGISAAVDENDLAKLKFRLVEVNAKLYFLRGNLQEAIELLRGAETDEGKILLIDALLWANEIKEAQKVADELESNSTKAELAKLRVILYRIQHLETKELVPAIKNTEKLLTQLRKAPDLQGLYSYMDGLSYQLILFEKWFELATKDGTVSLAESPFHGDDSAPSSNIVRKYLLQMNFLLNERDRLVSTIRDNGGSLSSRHRINRISSSNIMRFRTAFGLERLNSEWIAEIQNLRSDVESADRQLFDLINEFVTTHGDAGLIEFAQVLRQIAVRSFQRGNLTVAKKRISFLTDQLAEASTRRNLLSAEQAHWVDVSSAMINIAFTLERAVNESDELTMSTCNDLAKWGETLAKRQIIRQFYENGLAAYEAFLVSGVTFLKNDMPLQATKAKRGLRNIEMEMSNTHSEDLARISNEWLEIFERRQLKHYFDELMSPIRTKMTSAK